MNRNDFQSLARLRLREARILLKAKSWSGAYYLSGYVIECGLKACIAKNTKRFDFPEKNVVKQIYTHSLTKLVDAAGLEIDLKKRIDAEPRFATNWAVVKDWTEISRYEDHSRIKAQDLFSAITSRTYGVFGWLRQHW